MKNYVSTEEWLSTSRRVAGVMSGTSMDGIDVTIAEFSEHATAAGCRMKQEVCVSLEYSDEQRQYLLRLVEQPFPISTYCDLPVLLATWYNEAVQKACAELGISSAELDAIGVHGQTLWHAPQEHEVLGRPIRSTLQVCNGASLAVMSETTIVSDFRSGDVALGGQGAPLVPIFDVMFLHDSNEDRVSLNIGGMANITALGRDVRHETVQAFDTGPGNVWIDAAMQFLYGRAYDADGACARVGSLNSALFEELKGIDYITQPAPKSTGRELFSRASLQNYLQSRTQHVQAADVVRTISDFTVWSIVQNIRMVMPNCDRLIVSGGGSQNSYLMEALAGQLGTTAVVSSDSLGIASKSKESLCFAYLAWRRLAGLHSNLPSVTGAKRGTLLGQIACPG